MYRVIAYIPGTIAAITCKIPRMIPARYGSPIRLQFVRFAQVLVVPLALEGVTKGAGGGIPWLRGGAGRGGRPGIGWVWRGLAYEAPGRSWPRGLRRLR